MRTLALLTLLALLPACMATAYPMRAPADLSADQVAADEAACQGAANPSAGRVAVSLVSIALGVASAALGGPFTGLWAGPSAPAYEACLRAKGYVPVALSTAVGEGQAPPGL